MLLMKHWKISEKFFCSRCDFRRFNLNTTFNRFFFANSTLFTFSQIHTQANLILIWWLWIWGKPCKNILLLSQLFHAHIKSCMSTRVKTFFIKIIGTICYFYRIANRVLVKIQLENTRASFLKFKCGLFRISYKSSTSSINIVSRAAAATSATLQLPL